MHGAFGTVLWIVCIAGAVVALVALISSRKTWQDYGKNGLLLDSELSRPASGGAAAADREREEEIRQLIEARNAIRRRRGQELIDPERELARLSPPSIDPELRAEIRDLVIARNYRRARAGKPALDVESEVQRELDKLRDL